MKTFEVTVKMRLTAIDEKMAVGLAELNVFSATQGVRKANSGWITDDTTTFAVIGDPVEVINPQPMESYNKQKLIDTIGEDKAIAFLNNKMNILHP